MNQQEAQSFETLIELLRYRAETQLQKRAYTFLEDGEERATHLTYAELDHQARAIASHLQSLGAGGERVMLLFPSGLAYIAAFFGCLYAGAIAVPAYPPRPNRSLLRLHSIVENCGAKFALTTSELHARLEPALAETGLRDVRWLFSDSIVRENDGDAWKAPCVDGATLAFLQYTSGSTANPKGVMISHGNVLSNNRMVQCSFAQDEHSNGVGWLPLFHDMGLIGNVLQGLSLGSECILMAPESFLSKPVRWLQAISRYRAHTNGGPNFAYDLCARRISREQSADLDLSGWQVAFCGAEPIRSETLDTFAHAFAHCGFRPQAFYPCYGLAEASLFVTGGFQAELPVTADFSAEALQRDAIIAPRDEQDKKTLVGCGHAWLEGEIAIVDANSRFPSAPETIGEIWARGPHIGRGYWNNAEETERTFDAFLSGGAGPFLRTGDLGFIHDGELFVTGRLKDLMIFGGGNHYPDDIEQTTENSHSALRAGGCIAFSAEIAGAERLILVAEVERSFLSARREYSQATDAQSGATDELVNAARQAVAQHHDLRAYQVVLLRPATLPKTSSGKKQRHACRAAFLAGDFKSLDHVDTQLSK